MSFKYQIEDDFRAPPILRSGDVPEPTGDVTSVTGDYAMGQYGLGVIVRRDLVLSGPTNQTNGDHVTLRVSDTTYAAQILNGVFKITVPLSVSNTLPTDLDVAVKIRNEAGAVRVINKHLTLKAAPPVENLQYSSVDGGARIAWDKPAADTRISGYQILLDGVELNGNAEPGFIVPIAPGVAGVVTVYSIRDDGAFSVPKQIDVLISELPEGFQTAIDPPNATVLTAARQRLQITRPAGLYSVMIVAGTARTTYWDPEEPGVDRYRIENEFFRHRFDGTDNEAHMVVPTDGQTIYLSVTSIPDNGAGMPDWPRSITEQVEYTAPLVLAATKDAVFQGFGAIGPIPTLAPNNSHMLLTAAQNNQVIQELEIDYTGNPTAQKGLLSIDQGTTNLTIKRLYIKVPESPDWFMTGYPANGRLLHAYRANNLHIEECWLLGGYAGINLESCHGSRIEKIMCGGAARAAVIIDKEQTWLGKHGYVRKVLDWQYTPQEAADRGLTLHPEQERFTARSVQYNGEHDRFWFEDCVTIGGSGHHGQALVQNGPDASSNNGVYGRRAGGIGWRRCYSLFSANDMAVNAGGMGPEFEDVLGWQGPESPTGQYHGSALDPYRESHSEDDNDHARAFKMYDYGSPPVGEDLINDALERSIDMSGTQFRRCRFNYRSSTGASNGFQTVPEIGYSTFDAVDESRYYALPEAYRPSIDADSQFEDPTLSLQYVWAAARAALSDVEVFDDPDRSQPTGFVDFVNANPLL